jgi:Acetokinase family
MSPKRFNEMVNFQSGLLGVSEASSDMRDLLEHETQDVRAAEAVALFCYQVKNGLAHSPRRWVDWTRWSSRTVSERMRLRSATGFAMGWDSLESNWKKSEMPRMRA